MAAMAHIRIARSEAESSSSSAKAGRGPRRPEPPAPRLIRPLTLPLARSPVRPLQDFGVAAGDVKKLKEAGFYSVESVAYASRRELADVKGVSDAKVSKIKDAASQLVPSGFATAHTILAARGSLIRITTGSTALDGILGGGLESGSITEIYGEFRCGKTQLCHTLAVTSQIPVTHGGGEGKCLYIDTEGTFRPDRLVDIAERFQMDPEAVLNNIAFARAHNTEHQQELLAQAGALLSESRFSLIICDSATALFRTEYIGRGELASRQNNLGKFLKGLQRLADEYGVAVLVTNQVVQSGLDGAMSFGPSVKPIGGNIMAHATTTRLQLKKGRGSDRIANLIASPSMPENQATFGISQHGIGDASD